MTVGGRSPLPPDLRKMIWFAILRVAVIITVFLIVVAVAGKLLGCGGETNEETTAKTHCGDLNYAVVSGLNILNVYTVNDEYGVNSFFLWEVDDFSIPEKDDLRFSANGEKVEDFVLRDNWQPPDPIWATARWAMDGLDIQVFDEPHPFVVFYLPFTPRVSWQSNFGSLNNGDCPDNNVFIDGRFRCIGRNQLDELSPQFQSGKIYLMQMSMIVFAGENRNTVQSCYRAVVRW